MGSVNHRECRVGTAHHRKEESSTVVFVGNAHSSCLHLQEKNRRDCHVAGSKQVTETYEQWAPRNEREPQV
jgi:hypothetical protein